MIHLLLICEKNFSPSLLSEQFTETAIEISKLKIYTMEILTQKMVYAIICKAKEVFYIW